MSLYRTYVVSFIILDSGGRFMLALYRPRATGDLRKTESVPFERRAAAQSCVESIPVARGLYKANINLPPESSIMKEST